MFTWKDVKTVNGKLKCKRVTLGITLIRRSVLLGLARRKKITPMGL
jgi:hypothetical protein